MRIFYSWQSDSPGKINRNFIKVAIEKAISRINEDIVLDERESHSLVLDHDTKGVLGTPSVAETIFEKIVLADMLIADVTLVATSSSEKKHINSNVAIEVGYRRGSKGPSSYFQVMNATGGDAIELPFDLKHTRYPVVFNCSLDASDGARRAEREKFAKELEVRIRAHYDALNSSESRVGVEHEPVQNERDESVFWKQSEPFVKRVNSKVEYSFFVEHPVIVKVVPELKQATRSILECRELTKRSVPFDGDVGGISFGVNKFGAASFAVSGETKSVLCATQVHKNGEIWAIANDLVCQPEFDPIITDDWFVAAQSFRKHLALAIEQTLNLSREVIGGPSKIAVVAHNLEGVLILDGGNPRKRNAIMEDTVLHEVRVRDSLNPNTLCEQFITKLYAAAGMENPGRP